MQAVWRVGAASQSLGRPHVAPRGRGLSAPARRVSAPRTAPRARLALVGPCVRRRRPSDARSAERGERRRRPSDARSAERGGASSIQYLLGCSCATGFHTPPLPTAWLCLRRPSHARSAERGARSRRPSDARSAERGGASSTQYLLGCACATGFRTPPLPTAWLRLRRPSHARSAERGARRRRPSDARSAERGEVPSAVACPAARAPQALVYSCCCCCCCWPGCVLEATCARHRRLATVSSACLRSPRGRRAIGRVGA